MFIKKILLLLMSCLLVFSSVVVCNAQTVENEKVYNPLDLVVVVDSSGSMNWSDSNKTALDAVRMLVNMMPAEDSRVGIVGFNTKATVLTKNASGDDALINLKDFAGVETIRSGVSSIKYNGGTGIGNAVYAATELLNKCSDNEHTKAVILFTDGVNDFGYDRYSLSVCEENEVKAVKWAKENDCYIYCVGYDYVTSSGGSSMGAGGEGLLKLQNIADSTNGVCKAINNISDIEQLLIEFLADVCDLIYRTIATIPGDGGFHECPIPVSPSVVEANIRIAGGGSDEIKNGNIKLFDPSGKEVQLANSGNVRYDSDATAASIKVIMPKAGDWLLTVNGISGDDIHVGLLEHFKMNLTSQLIFPENNPRGVAYTNDVIGIKTWLTYEDVDLDSDEIYDAVTSAAAVCVSRANPDDVKTIALTRDGRSFVGSFTIPEDSYYDIAIRLEWDTVYREDALEVKSSNSPPKANGTIGDIKVNKGKTETISNIYQYVYDAENDPITVTVKNSSNADAADLTINGDNLDVKGVKGWWASTLVTLEYKDDNGNTVEQMFAVKVEDPLLVAILVLIGLLLLIAVILILRSVKNLFNVVPGYIKVKYIAKGFIKNGSFVMSELIYQNPSVVGSAVNDVEKSREFYGAGNDPFSASSYTGSIEPETFGSQDEWMASDIGSLFGDTPTFSGTGDLFGTDTADLFGDESANGRDEESVSAGESVKSNLFNQSVELSQAGVKKAVLSKALECFVANYKAAMNEGISDGQKSVLAERVEKIVNNHFIPYLGKFVFIGTSFGRNGAYLKVNRSELNKTLIVHSPYLAKKKIHLSISKSDVLLSFSVKEDQKDEEGRIPCHHIEIAYSKFE